MLTNTRMQYKRFQLSSMSSFRVQEKQQPNKHQLLLGIQRQQITLTAQPIFSVYTSHRQPCVQTISTLHMMSKLG